MPDWSGLITISIPYYVPGGGGVATEMGRWEGGFSRPNDKPDIDGKPYPAILYNNYGFQNKIGTGCDE